MKLCYLLLAQAKLELCHCHSSACCLNLLGDKMCRFSMKKEENVEYFSCNILVRRKHWDKNPIGVLGKMDNYK